MCAYIHVSILRVSIIILLKLKIMMIQCHENYDQMVVKINVQDGHKKLHMHAQYSFMAVQKVFFAAPGQSAATFANLRPPSLGSFKAIPSLAVVHCSLSNLIICVHYKWT